MLQIANEEEIEGVLIEKIQPMPSLVTIVIPLYREQLPPLELRILQHNLSVLAAHPITFILPEGLSTTIMQQQFDIDKYEQLRVSNRWMGAGKGVAGYNKMMTSMAFYTKFVDYKYILICHTDAYLFRDEVVMWCNKGYDYIGAPWIKKAKYNHPLFKLQFKLKQLLLGRRSKFLQHQLFERVGNGGLSLRKVSSCIEACNAYYGERTSMLAMPHHLNNEDVFWALVPNRFKYPTYKDAAHFALDLKPELGMQLTEGKLPFGCHGLTVERIYKFWEDKLEL